MYYKFYFTLLSILLALSPSPTVAVKSYLFKTCDQSGFCHRNRHFANEVAKLNNQYDSRYSISLESLHIQNEQGLVEGSLLKQLNDGSHIPLSFQVSVLDDYNIRLKIDEPNRKHGSKLINSKRYDEASKWSLVEEPQLVPFEYDLDQDKLTLTYGNDYSTVIYLNAFKLEISYKDQLQLVLNDRNFLNLEHYRTRQQNEVENSIHISPEESTFDSFEDSFKDSKDDKIPLGPESVAMDFTLVGYQTVYGIPEHADTLSLKDTRGTDPYRLFNVDIFEYETESKMPMYGSIPFMIAMGPKTSTGVFWINSADTYIDISKVEPQIDEQKVEKILTNESQTPQVETHWMSENGIIDVILIVKDSPSQVSSSYSKLVGHTALPSLFSLGYHQSRWNYNDEADVLDITSKFDEHQIPYDTIWLDVEYAIEKKYFTWKPEAFPDPERMLRKLDETGRTLVAIIDPHLKTGYPISKQVEKLNIGIKNSDDNGAYHGHCWPGESVWIDTLNPNAQSFWDDQFKNGSDLMGHATNLHIWNDMNEPSIFNGPETTSPKDNIHYGQWEHRSIHNLYGLTYHEATYNALLARNPNLRPFILTRAFYSGSQRTSAVWTGDNMSEWKYLKASIPQVLTLNVVGYQFSGADVAGFFGNPDKELLARWYQTAVFYPFFRAHAHIDSRRHEPWVAGEPYTSVMRDAIKLRYKLLPVLYTQFYKSSLTGSPIIRPVSYETPENVETYGIDDQFFFDNLLVKPVTSAGQTQVSIFIPDNEPYYDFTTFDKFEGEGYHNVESPLNKIPILIKSGSILPIKNRYRRSSKLMKFDPYTLYITLNKSGEAKGELYVDDGESFDSTNNDDYILLDLQMKNGVISSRLISGDASKPFTSKLNNVKVERIILIGSPSAEVSNAQINQGDDEWSAEVQDNETHLIIRNPKVQINKEWNITL